MAWLGAKLAGCSSDRGSFSASAAMVMGLLFVGCLSMAVVTHSSVEAASAADAAAQAAARAATRAQTPGGAQRAAETAAAGNAKNSSATCEITELEVGTMAPGESVTVSVSCESAEAGFGRYTTLGRAYEGQATEVIDAFRSGEAE